MEQISSDLHERALGSVRWHYEIAADMRDFVLRGGLERINRVRLPSLRYGSVDEVFREYVHVAGAVSTFAVNMGLISPEEATQIILDFNKAHPELPRDEDLEIPSD